MSLIFFIDNLNTTYFANLVGVNNENLHLIEKRLNVKILNRGNKFEIIGEEKIKEITKNLLEKLYTEAQKKSVSLELINLFLQNNNLKDLNQNYKTQIIKTHKKSINTKGRNQNIYVERIFQNDINFGIGPAGTGKTFLAVACAVQALEQEKVKKIMLVRPAVEAGEKLGFLPGDLSQKIDPYLRPLYDSLYEMLGFEVVNRFLEKQIIEVAPLAYMRGRTLNNSFIILDESQNTTPEQMKMFLTRIGFGSIAVITGDITQIDLPKGIKSGLKHSLNILKDIKGISFSEFNSKDVVRHPLVQKIIEAYEAFDK